MPRGSMSPATPAGLLLRKGKTNQGAAEETPGGDASSSNKGVVEDVIDLDASPLRRKARTSRKDAGKGCCCGGKCSLRRCR